MSTITASDHTESGYTKTEEQARRRFVDRLRDFGESFWAYTEETGETNTKPFEGWQ